MSYLKPINLIIESNMDADDYGQRIVECIKQLDPNSDVVNIVKINVQDQSWSKTAVIMQELKNHIDKITSNNNIIYVPVGLGINDIQIDHIKVVSE